jgi:hypothetical protein
MNAPAKPRFSWPQVVTAVIVVILLLTLLMALRLRYDGDERGPESIANCRQVVLSIRLYAADEGGVFPDAKVPDLQYSNAAFHELIVSGSLEDEKIFGCGLSPFMPDGQIGEKPDYVRAVEPGENHWAMTKGLTDSSPAGIPLVYENPVDATWPPTWNADAAGKRVKGRSWKGGKIIVGTNDTSVEVMKLESKEGSNVTLRPLGPAGKPGELFSARSDGSKYAALDVAVPKP